MLSETTPIPTESSPPWKVYFSGNFWGHAPYERAGKELSLKKHFTWGGQAWQIPALYLCSKGLVIDFCTQVPRCSVAAFLEKWALSPENDGSDFTEEQRLLVESENPLSTSFSLSVFVNDKQLTSMRGCGAVWNPFFPERNRREVEKLCQQYGLNPAEGWSITRCCLSWLTARKPTLRKLQLVLERDPVASPGIHFHVTQPGDCIAFTHPRTGLQHSLTIQEYEKKEMPHSCFCDQSREYPTHYTAIRYTVFPDVPEGTFYVCAADEGDQSRQIAEDPCAPTVRDGCSVFGVIGHSELSEEVLFGCSGQGKSRTAYSALYFDPTVAMEWRMIFQEKPCDCENLTLSLI